MSLLTVHALHSQLDVPTRPKISINIQRVQVKQHWPHSGLLSIRPGPSLTTGGRILDTPSERQGSKARARSSEPSSFHIFTADAPVDRPFERTRHSNARGSAPTGPSSGQQAAQQPGERERSPRAWSRWSSSRHRRHDTTSSHQRISFSCHYKLALAIWLRFRGGREDTSYPFARYNLPPLGCNCRAVQKRRILV